MAAVSGGILIEVSPGEKRAAIVDDDGRLVELLIERMDRPAMEGGIHLGRVTRVEASLNGAFVALAGGQDGFLRRSKGVHEGQPVVVQVTREASGGKGPTLTDRPSIVGRYLALTPTRTDVTYSARLGSGRRRAQLEALTPRLQADTGFGFAMRAAAVSAADEDMIAEAARLREDWSRVEEAAEKQKAPVALAPPPGLIARVLRDREGSQVVIDDPLAFRKAEALTGDRMPGWRGLLQRHDGATPLFEAYGVAEDIDAVCDRIVTLPDGIRLTVDPLEALTAIDVDSGAGGRRTSDDAILRVNRAALVEVARQVRVRNLSGLIVVDFLNMRRKGVRSEFLQAARRAFRGDPVQVDVMGLTAAGLLELTRRRIAPPLHDLLTIRANARPSAEASACAALRAVLRLTGPGRPAVIAAPAVIDALQGPLSAARAEVDRRMGQKVMLRAEGSRRDWDVALQRANPGEEA